MIGKDIKAFITIRALLGEYSFHARSRVSLPGAILDIDLPY